VPDPLPTATSLSQWGVTWNFSTAKEYGQFTNGDYWVLGSTTINTITPASTSGSRIKNGSEVNPTAGATQQGYDNTMPANAYIGGRNVGLNLSAGSPLVLDPSTGIKSLVSSISQASAASTPQIKTCAVLTVLATQPADDAFRPPYSGYAGKTVDYAFSDVDTGMLQAVTPSAGAPSWASIEAKIERCWLDSSPNWMGSYMHPADNMEHYARDMSTDISIVSLMLNSDYTIAQKTPTLKGLIQYGIDSYGITLAGGATSNWPANGGHNSSRKWPCLFAGIIMTKQELIDRAGIHPSAGPVWWGEDMQVFYVAETSPSVYNFGYGGYGAGDVGLAEWGSAHWNTAQWDNKTWFLPTGPTQYRVCCTMFGWLGFILAARMLTGAKTEWAHPAMFDYAIRFAGRQGGDFRCSNDWMEAMWDAHTGTFPGT